MNRKETTTVAHIFDWAGNKNPDVLFLVALGGHRRWGNPPGRCTETEWAGCGENAQGLGRHPYAGYIDDQRYTAAEETPTLTSCRNCSPITKTQLSKLDVGVGVRPGETAEGKEVGAYNQSVFEQSIANQE